MAATLTPWLKKITGFVPRLWSVVVLEKFRVAGIVILGLGLVGVVAAFGFLFWFTPSATSDNLPPREYRLNTALIDQLEFWIEEVDGQRRVGLTLPPRPVFVIDDLPAGP